MTYEFTYFINTQLTVLGLIYNDIMGFFAWNPSESISLIKANEIYQKYG